MHNRTVVRKQACLWNSGKVEVTNGRARFYQVVFEVGGEIAGSQQLRSRRLTPGPSRRIMSRLRKDSMHSSQPRKVTNLSDSTTRQLSTYALAASAASAAGVGVLALTQPVEAEIVYTPGHHMIHANQTYQLDLNHDGTSDFELKNVFHTFSGNSAGYMRILPDASANEVWAARAPGCGSEDLCAAALPKGRSVGPKGSFTQDFPRGELMAVSDIVSGTSGSWLNVTRYLGLKFIISGKTHYGWARLEVRVQRFVFTATLTGYAYETIPGKPIIAGATKGPEDAESSAPASTPSSELSFEPTTLSVLALGAPGLSIWKREESVVAAPKSN